MTLTNDTENTKSLTAEAEAVVSDTLADRYWTLAEDSGTLGQPGTHIQNNSKNSISLTNEAI